MLKLLIPLILIINSFVFQNHVEIKDDKSVDEDSKLVQIVKIDKIKNFYVIYAKDNKNNYQIVSKKVKHCKDCIKIKKGGSYNLILTPMLEGNDYLMFYATDVMVDGVLIPLDKEYGSNIYISENLKGKYYLPNKEYSSPKNSE